MNNTETTLNYYNEKAKSFVEGTLNVNFSDLQDEFAALVEKGGRILDLGCGSGRDSKAFLQMGYDVVAVDGSQELCKLASEYIGQPVICTTFQDYKPEGTFDGIWACASLLHLDYETVLQTMQKLTASLKQNGIFYVSFKYGSFCGDRNGRFFLDMDEQSFASLLEKIPELAVVKQCITVDVRPGRDSEKWLNVFLKKV